MASPLPALTLVGQLPPTCIRECVADDTPARAGLRVPAVNWSLSTPHRRECFQVHNAAGATRATGADSGTTRLVSGLDSCPVARQLPLETYPAEVACPLTEFLLRSFSQAAPFKMLPQQFDRSKVAMIVQLAGRLLDGREVILLYGGESSERQGSIEAADEIRPILQARGAHVIDCDLRDRDRFWAKIRTADLVFNCLYGGIGEDGTVQGALSLAARAYTGSGVLASAVGMNKNVFKLVVKGLGYHTPAWLTGDQPLPLIRQLLLTSPSGAVVAKPIAEGDSYGISVCRDLTQLEALLSEISSADRRNWMIEQYYNGRPGTIAAIGIGESCWVSDALVFTLPDGHDHYSTTLKYQEHLQFSRSREAWHQITEQAIARVYSELHCRGPVRLDFVVANDTVTILELNTLPGLYRNSNLHMAFGETMSVEQLVMASVHSALLGH